MNYSQRRHKKLKPNKAQRENLTANFAAMSSATDARVAPRSFKPKKIAAPPLPVGPFQDKAGVSYVRESRSMRPEKHGMTVRRRGPRPVDTKRAKRLSKTLNQHSK